MPSTKTLRRLILSACSILAAGALTGCVPQSKYDDLLTAYRSKEQQVLTLQGDVDASRANELALRQQLAQAAADLSSARGMMDGSGNLDELRSRYEALLARINSLETPLPASVTDALTVLAQQNPEIFDFDARLGLLRFKSDVTFDSGSAQLSSKASEVLTKIAAILRTGDAANLEVKVVGHTDTVPISRPATREKHPTNMYLSAHRAISVRDALVRAGVQAGRFQVAGYGEFRPIVANSANGARENRRVEVFLVPMSVDLASLPTGTDLPGATPAVRTATPARGVVQPRANVDESTK